MTVRELIQELSGLPQEANVGYVWDGAMRSMVGAVWQSRTGHVVLCSTAEWEYVYYDHDRPTWAQTAEQVPYWRPKAEDNSTGM